MLNAQRYPHRQTRAHNIAYPIALSAVQPCGACAPQTPSRVRQVPISTTSLFPARWPSDSGTNRHRFDAGHSTRAHVDRGFSRQAASWAFSTRLAAGCMPGSEPASRMCGMRPCRNSVGDRANGSRFPSPEWTVALQRRRRGRSIHHRTATRSAAAAAKEETKVVAQPPGDPGRRKCGVRRPCRQFGGVAARRTGAQRIQRSGRARGPDSEIVASGSNPWHVRARASHTARLFPRDPASHHRDHYHRALAQGRCAG